jgi:hypothetical protein
MKSLRLGATIFCVAVLTGALNTACRSHYVVVPGPSGQYTPTDTLRGHLRGDMVRVTFRYDTVTRIRTVTRLDTVYLADPDTVFRIETLLQVDTVRTTRPIIRTDTVLRVDTVRVPEADVGPRGDRVRTVVRVDTVRVTDTVTRVDTVRVTDTVTRVDTVRVTDTVTRVDTVLRVDTVRVVETVHLPGRRVLFVPPGHYPPDGQCRVWIHDRPPGQQQAASACDAIRSVPAGAFILFGGDAWDFDFDWIAEAQRTPGAVPPEIVALKRRGGGR